MRPARPRRRGGVRHPLRLAAVGDGSFTIQQLSNGRFVDAHDTAANDFTVVTRPPQNNGSQRWTLAQP